MIFPCRGTGWLLYSESTTVSEQVTLKSFKLQPAPRSNPGCEVRISDSKARGSPCECGHEGPLCSRCGVGRRASREGVCCVPVFWEKDSAHSCSEGVNAKQTCLTHASPSAVMALLSKTPPPLYTYLCASPFHVVHWLKAAAPPPHRSAGSDPETHGQPRKAF